jgi:lysylphosphatidylglycerol synthase-like protein
LLSINLQSLALDGFVLKMTQTARRLTRAALALCILAWLVRSVGFDRILLDLERASLPMLFAATALLALDGIAKARNWQQLLLASVDGGDRVLPLLRVMRWHFAGGFVGALVPSSASTDACRVWMAVRGLRGQTAPCAASILTVNCLGWFSGSVIGLAGVALLAHTGQLPRLLQPVALVFLFTLTVLPIAYGMLASRREWVERLIERVGRRSTHAQAGLTKFLDALLVFEHAGLRFPIFLLVSAAGLLAQTGMFALTAAAVGIDVPFALWMMLVPLTRIVALIPVSIADFGLIQAAHVTVLALFGVPASQSFALSALFAIEGLLIHSTAGATAFLLAGRWRRRFPPFGDPASFRLDGPDSVR